MTQNGNNLDYTKAQALEFLSDTQSFLLITCADHAKRIGPQMVGTITSEKEMTLTLAHLLVHIPAFHRMMSNALIVANDRRGIQN